MYQTSIWKSEKTSRLTICRYKTCSCPLVRYFWTLFWDDITIIWDENIVYFYNREKKLFWTNKKFVYLIFMSKTT